MDNMCTKMNEAQETNELILQALEEVKMYRREDFKTSIDSENRLGRITCLLAGCYKSYKSKFSLQRHLQGHLKIKPFECQFCDKAFALKQYLKDHLNIHTGEKPYKCDFPGCAEAFKQAGLLSLHKKSDHPHQNIISKIGRL